MNPQESSLEIDAQDYGPELINTMQDYLAIKQEEGTAFPPVTSDQLPQELKDDMGLDMFSEDIQNDILALAQKITDYALELVARSKEETGYLPPAFGRLGSCIQQAPYRDIARDAWKGGSTAARYGRFLPGPTGKAVQPFMRPAGMIATAGAAWAGSIIGCMQRGR